MELIRTILSQLTSLLNRLSIIEYREGTDGTASLPKATATVLLGVAIILSVLMSSRIERKLAFIVDGIELHKTSAVTIGDRSDISYKGVPEGYLRISRDGDTFTWSVDPQYRDTLQYFKINDQNPNLHLISNDDSQVLTLRLPTSRRDTIRLQLTGAQIWKTWKHFGKQRDVMLRHLAAYCRLHDAATGDAERSQLLDQMQQPAVRSFVEHDGNSMKLVILDDLTQITQDGKTQGYCRSGTATSREGCKVQFFTVTDYCYMEDSAERGYFSIDGVNYVMKTSVRLTEWGAGHVMLTPQGDNIRVSFQHPVTYVGSVDSLRSRSRGSGNIITLKQDNNSFPSKSDLYLPSFSNALNYDLCNIEFVHGKDSITLRDNNNAEHVVQNPRTWKLPVSLIPALSKMTLHSGNDLLYCRAGLINKSFVMSYMWLPLTTCLALILLVWLPTSTVRLSRRQQEGLYNRKLLKSYPLYLTLLLLSCLVYCSFKSLIAIKLSYSYPYFEKLTGIIPFSASLTMLLFYSLGQVINTPLRHESVRKGKHNSLLLNWLCCAVLSVFIAYMFFNVGDPAISQGMIDSYYRDEVYVLWPPLWMSKYGIKDTHRSVVYALLFVQAVTLAVWAAADLCRKTLPARIGKLSSWCDATASLCRDKAGHYLTHNKLTDKVSGRDAKVRLSVLATMLLCTLLVQVLAGPSLLLLVLSLGATAASCLVSFVREALTGAVKVLFPWHLLLIILLVVIGNKAGNFGTAFITLIVILGLSHALTRVPITKDGPRRHVIFGQMIIISLVYTIGAMAGDKGYMTNFIGIEICLVSYFFMMSRPAPYEKRLQKESLTEKRWVNWLLAVIVLLLVAMPRLCSHLYSADDVNFGRIARRIMLFSSFEDLEKSGYRYSESDAEFMVIMSHYMQDSSGSDPLSNDLHPLHASVSTGQSPVVINDLSVPIAFFGSYGRVLSTAAFFVMLMVLIWSVLQLSLSYTDPQAPSLTRAMQWRLLAMSMWAGTSLYIYLSYIDRLPFTGRLIPGFGVDAVGEAIETAILLAFMSAVTCRKSSSYFNKTTDKRASTQSL